MGSPPRRAGTASNLATLKVTPVQCLQLRLLNQLNRYPETKKRNRHLAGLKIAIGPGVGSGFSVVLVEPVTGSRSANTALSPRNRPEFLRFSN
jgi:hypothetical protein